MVRAFLTAVDSGAACGDAGVRGDAGACGDVGACAETVLTGHGAPSASSVARTSATRPDREEGSRPRCFIDAPSYQALRAAIMTRSAGVAMTTTQWCHSRSEKRE